MLGSAEVMGPFVGGVEIACGALLVLGLLTRLATVPLLVDITMLMGLIFLLIVGAGPWSLDALWSRRPPASPPTPV